MDTYFKIAAEEAEYGIMHNHGGPFGAVVVMNNKVISVAHNEVVLRNDPTAHAEILAIREAAKKMSDFNLSGAILYSTTEPCPMCLSAIMWARISKVVYACSREDASRAGFDDSRFYEAISNLEHQQLVTMTQKQSDECQEVFRKYRSLDNKTHY